MTGASSVRRWVAAASMMAAAAAPGADRITLAVPGVPPVFSGLFAFVAKEQGFFKKHGVDVEVRPFDSGASAAQAVVSGDVDLALSPTAAIVRMVSNGGVGLVGIYGQEHPDWLLASAQAGKKCADLKDQPVGVDSVGGARAVALAEFLHACNLTLDQVKLVGLSSNVGAAMVAGQIKFGVLHTDDVPVLEEQLGHPLAVIATFHEVSPVTHYNLLVTTREKLASRRDTLVRVIAGLIEATRFMADKKNLDRLAQIATVTGRSTAVAHKALPHFLEIEFWPLGSDGMGKDKVEHVIAVEKRSGGIKPGKTPVPYDRLVDHGLWKEASALVK